MYSELKTKCEEMINELMAIKPDLVDGGCIKDVKAGHMLQFINSASRELHHVINTINAYYSED